MIVTTRGFLLIALAAATVLSGCGKSMLTSRIESDIEARLPEIIGPARSYRVEVDGNASRMVKGSMREIRIYGEGVSVTPSLTVDDLKVRLEDVDFDKRSQSIKSCASTDFQACVLETTLNAHLRSARSDLKDLRVKLRPNKMMVHTRPSLLKISFGVDLEGTLNVVDADKVFFKVDRLMLGGLKMPEMIADYVEERINPVQDLSEAGMSVRLTSVTIGSGSLEMRGTADIGSARVTR